MARPAKPEKGQHFLHGAPDAVARIVKAAAVAPGERVLDVGAGTGAFTERLSEAVGPLGRVTAIELDRDLAARLERRRLANVDVVAADALRVPWPKPLDAVVANPPYVILSPLLLRIAAEGVGRAVLVIPNELRDRLTAKAGTEPYGKLTVRMALRGRTESLFSVPRRAFDPPPSVPSCAIRFTPAAPDVDLALADRVLDVAWENRKKILRHALSPLDKALGLPPQDITEALRAEGVASLTPEQASPRVWALLVQRLADSVARRSGRV